jgi:rhamnulokinase
MAAAANFLAADLGASNGRVLLGKWDGERFALEVLHRFENGPTNILGRLYWDVLSLWREVKVGMMRYAADYRAPLAGVGIDTWGVDYGLLDAAGRLLGNPVHYRDSRTQGMVDHLFTRIPKPEVFDVTGIQFLELNTLFQLYSMRVQGDPQLDAAHRLLLMPDLFHYWLSGAQVAEYTIASTTQMLLAHERTWATDLLNRLDLPTAILPEIVQPGTVIGPLLAQVAAETGIPAGAPVVASAAHDTGSAVAAIPGLDARSVYLSSGTWSLMGIEVRQPIINAKMLDLNFTNEGGVDGTIRLLKNISGLWLLQESRRQWEREGHAFSWEELMMEAQKAPAFRSIINSDAPDFNTPSSMVEAIRTFCRRTHQPDPQTPGEVVRCCLESLALRYRWVVEALEEILASAGLSSGRQLETIRVVGGGSQNRLLNQFTADACGRTVVTGPVEAAALGVIMMQAVATGHLANVREGRAAIAASIQQELFEPRAQDGWDEAYARFLRMIE